jgi:hypothetical protein
MDFANYLNYGIDIIYIFITMGYVNCANRIIVKMNITILKNLSIDHENSQ